jgi:hypothetical protein
MKFHGMEVTRVSRQCYDKPHRCPGWAGGGWHYTDDSICQSGYVDWYGYTDPTTGEWVDKRLKKFRANTCRKQCGTLVLPYATRYVDPTWWKYEAESRWDDILYWRWGYPKHVIRDRWIIWKIRREHR